MKKFTIPKYVRDILSRSCFAVDTVGFRDDDDPGYTILIFKRSDMTWADTLKDECDRLEECEKGFYIPANDGAGAAKAGTGLGEPPVPPRPGDPGQDSLPPSVRPRGRLRPDHAPPGAPYPKNKPLNITHHETVQAKLRN